MKKKSWVLFFLMAMFSANLMAQNSPKWAEINTALANGNKEKRPVFIFVYATWCPACRKMEQMTLNDSSVIQLMDKNYINVKLNADLQETAVRYDGNQYKAGEFVSAFQIRGIPSYIFIDKHGKAVGAIPGVYEPKKFISLLTYINDECYLKKIQFDAYEENPKLCAASSK